MGIDKDGSLAIVLKQFLEETGEVERAVEALAADQGIPKRIAESIACGMGLFPQRYKANQGTLGSAGQERLLQSKVLIAGLGGLGGYVLEQLVRCGAGVVIGVDADQFDKTNLNRQLLADLYSIGSSKIEAAGRRVGAINDAVEFYPCEGEIEDIENTVYDGVNLIFDCLDKISVKLYLQDVAERLAIPLVHGAIAGWYGQVAVVWPESQLLRTIYGAKREGIERAVGNPPFTPALTASLMVAEGIKVLLGKRQKDNGVFFVDLLHNQWEYVTL